MCFELGVSVEFKVKLERVAVAYRTLETGRDLVHGEGAFDQGVDYGDVGLE